MDSSFSILSAFVHTIDPDYIEDPPPFRLLDLPRELRDLIYEHMVIPGYVYIEPALCWEERRSKLRHYTRLRKKQRKRSTFYRSRDDVGGFSSYEECHFINADRVNSSIFFANRQIYQEVTPIFYSRNRFSFTTTGREIHGNIIPAALAFLKDRSSLALGHLQSISLSIESVWEGCPLGIFVDETYVQQLVDFINNNLKLKKLTLFFFGWPPGVRSSSWDWVTPDSDSADACPPLLWIGALLSLKRVTTLMVTMRAKDQGPVERLVRFVRLLRSSLLVNGEVLAARNIQVHRRHFAPWMDMKDPSKPFAGFKRKNGMRALCVTSHDNAEGESFLEPAVRETDLWEGALAKRTRNGEDRKYAEEVLRAEANKSRRYLVHDSEDMDSEISDWDASDDGENDSLIEQDLSGANLDCAEDKEYFEEFRRWRDSSEERKKVFGEAWKAGDMES